MSLSLTSLGGHMAAAVEGIDLNQPPDTTTAGDLRRALLDHLVLCIRGQALAPLPYRDAMRVFGTPMKQITPAATHPDCDEILVLSSEDRDTLGDGKKLVVGAHWHTDDSYKAVPCALTMLYGIDVPATGGDTQFTNMYAAYDRLPAAMKDRIAGLSAIHTYDSSRKGTRVAKRTDTDMARMPAVTHPLVRTHPETGRKALYLNPNRMEQVAGLERAESDALLDALIAHAIQPQYQYRHRWQQGDIVVWDNRCTMHKANADYPEGARRRMHRVIVEGTVPV
ncbi:TauD/TfdA family dioxygenase [Reyranella sp. CPCC 100927]|uniref:TauD/TfdA dioxygenase family protein n=1 Tax=Reyranella sp. CPCC 100927 TaxID=2599616 RepID=UPI0011B78BEA|nr:TauD/TfdA family dioxygenase [Reyranella sp. CPCC 100927]TWT12977.1 TauD/TfdA family dioxygenase [Reyranella sp. CPCC 100927]